MDDDELERAVRAGLEGRAERAVVDPLVVARARAAVRRRRTTRVAVLGAAAAVLAVVGVVAVVADRDASSPPLVPATSDAAPPAGEVRTEYWHRVRVDVPADWGYGNPVLCGDVPTGEPYVGRPITVTDDCGPFDPDATPTAPYVWFDVADVPVGTEDLGDGWTRETREVARTRVSVATQDASSRQRILGSVARGELCPTSLFGAPEARYDVTDEGTGEMLSARVCAYRGDRFGDYALVYARDLDRTVAAETFAAVESSSSDDRCDRLPDELVVVHATYDDSYGSTDLRRDAVYDLSCGVVRSAAPYESEQPHRLTEATVPWAGPEFRRLLTGPSDPWAYDRFIGIQG